MAKRWLTFRQLKERGWPHSRQWTDKLVRARKIPGPKKRPGGGTLNLWDEDEWSAFTATFVSTHPAPASITLTDCLVDALSTDSVEDIVAAIGQLRTALEREGANPNDIVVTLKERPAGMAQQAAPEIDTS